ncbi:MAG: hypothetical protein ACHQZR_05220 [Candidatus Limnocylindrales bacterium]
MSRWVPQPPATAAHPGRVLLSPLGLTLLGLTQLADFFTFRTMLAVHGAAAELNPLAIALQGNSLYLALTAKLTVWALVAAIAAVLATTHPGLARFVIVFGIVVGLFGALSNVASI